MQVVNKLANIWVLHRTFCVYFFHFHALFPFSAPLSKWCSSIFHILLDFYVCSPLYFGYQCWILCITRIFGYWTCLPTCSCCKWRKMIAMHRRYFTHTHTHILCFASRCFAFVFDLFNYSSFTLSIYSDCREQQFRIPNVNRHFIIDTFYIPNVIRHKMLLLSKRRSTEKNACTVSTMA